MATRGSQARTAQIQAFIVENVTVHPRDITAQVAEQFGISRQAAHRHIQKLVAAGMLLSQGDTRNRRYSLKPIAEARFSVAIVPGLAEDVVWRQRIRPLLQGIAPNVLGICEYGFTEILNNAIEHSAGSRIDIGLVYTLSQIEIHISDDGIGIFHKIQSELQLEDERQAILEVAKGKLTTDPGRHSGEGIFFTSRSFDEFSILSGALFFCHNELDDDWLIDVREPVLGTTVLMQYATRSTRRTQDVFDKYASPDEDFGFTRTRVAVALARYGDENLVSRSQARRLLARFDRFRHVVLDFKDVETIGQAFADEIFRVYAAQHPAVVLTWVGASEQVEKMIRRAQSHE